MERSSAQDSKQVHAMSALPMACIVPVILASFINAIIVRRRATVGQCAGHWSSQPTVERPQEKEKVKEKGKAKERVAERTLARAAVRRRSFHGTSGEIRSHRMPN